MATGLLVLFSIPRKTSLVAPEPSFLVAVHEYLASIDTAPVADLRRPPPDDAAPVDSLDAERSGDSWDDTAAAAAPFLLMHTPMLVDEVCGGGRDSQANGQ